jgi:hypothetical protein
MMLLRADDRLDLVAYTSTSAGPTRRSSSVSDAAASHTAGRARHS